MAKKTGRKGKYGEWITEEGLKKLEEWAKAGLTDVQIAHNMGIAPGTLYEWKNRFPEIDEALKKGKEVVDLEVENALLKRALGYDYEETKIIVETDGRKRIERVKKHVPPDITAQIFWLKNRTTRWSNRDKVEVEKILAETALIKEKTKLIRGVEKDIHPLIELAKALQDDVTEEKTESEQGEQGEGE